MPDKPIQAPRRPCTPLFGVRWSHGLALRTLPDPSLVNALTRSCARMRGAAALFIALSLATVLEAQQATPPATAPFATAAGGFFALSVPDLDASVAWYSRVFGMRRTFTIPPMGEIVGGALLESEGLVVELLQRRDATPGRRPAELTQGVAKAGVLVSNFDGTVAALRARGAAFAMGPFPGRPGQRPSVVLVDTAGNYVQVLGPIVR